MLSIEWDLFRACISSVAVLAVSQPRALWIKCLRLKKKQNSQNNFMNLNILLRFFSSLHQFIYFSSSTQILLLWIINVI